MWNLPFKPAETRSSPDPQATLPVAGGNKMLTAHKCASIAPYNIHNSVLLIAVTCRFCCSSFRKAIKAEVRPFMYRSIIRKRTRLSTWQLLLQQKKSYPAEGNLSSKNLQLR